MCPEILFSLFQYNKFVVQSRSAAIAGVLYDYMYPCNSVRGKEQLSRWSRARCKQRKAVRSLHGALCGTEIRNQNLQEAGALMVTELC